MVQILQTSLNSDQTITPSCLKDPIFVSIDVGADGTGRVETIGIATLDTRLLTIARTEDCITARLLLLRRRYLPFNTYTRAFVFGTLEYSPPDDAREVPLAILRLVNHEHSGFRNILLVGHNIQSDIKFLKDTFNFYITLTSSITTSIDTQKLARVVFDLPNKCTSLKRILSSLGIMKRTLHNSGNDAVYTLKAMLHMFCNYQEDPMVQKDLCVGPLHRERDDEGGMLWWERLDFLSEIAKCYPREFSRQEAMQGRRQPRPARVENPDFFESDSTSSEEMGCAMISMFGDED